jgi:acetyl-CoA carboxylase, biotin carboxylase subunit
VYYDSMLSKLVAWAGTREEARLRMLRALGEYHVGGIHTTLPFFQWMLRHEAFVAGTVDTTFLDAELRTRAGVPFATPTPAVGELAVAATALDLWFNAAAGERPAAAGRPASRWADAARRASLRR